jgi:biopolymer transport protein ExbD
MAMSRGRRDDEPDEMSEINVTPFIDVMLVLLIVFMVAAPLSTVDVAVNLPASTAPPTDRPQDPLWLTLAVDGSLILGSEPLVPADLAARLDAATGGVRETPVFVRADRSIPYGTLMALLGDLRGAGYLNIALVGLDAGTPGP